MASAGVIRMCSSKIFQACFARNSFCLYDKQHILQYCTFKSRYSLDKIYPNSSLNIATIPEPPKNADNKFSGFIPLDKVKITYSCSSGPGGQNVNKVNSKVEVRFHLESATWIPENARKRMLEMHKNSLTKEGELIIKSEKTRMQILNQADCFDKLRCMIREACRKPPECLPETKEMIRRRQEKAAASRLRQKRMHSMTKASRKAPPVNL